jgi:manganese oxidase
VPEWLSMNMMAAGMFPTMALLMMGRDMREMEPTEPLFWAVMSVGVIVGFATAYPVDVWMVARNMKHGLMTSRPDEEKERHGSGGHRMRWDVTRPPLSAVAVLTVIAALLGTILSAQKVNLVLSADDVGGAIMTRDTAGEAMRVMSAIDPELASYTAPPNARGFSYYAGGMRVAKIVDNKLVEVGHYIDTGGNNVWGVQVFQHGGQEYFAASDMDHGLYIFRYTGSA